MRTGTIAVVAEQAPEKPGIGFLPKLLFVALAVIGAIALVQWVLGWFFAAVKLVVVIAFFVLVGYLMIKFSRRGDVE